MLVKNAFRYLFLLLGLLGLLCFPSQSAEAVREGLTICGTSVIPALFPFFVLTNFFLGSRKSRQPSRLADKVMRACFGLSGSCMMPLLLSFFGGYPVGASCAVQQYQKGAISKQDAEHLLLFCNNSGPAFFLGVVGAAVLQDIRFGLLLYLVHILSALCCGVLLRSPVENGVKLRRIPAAQPKGGSFLQAISATCAALLQISGLILFFSVVLAVLEASGLLALLSRLLPWIAASELGAILSGTLELSSGIIRLTACENAAVLCAFFMGWGGICVHLQAMSFWQPCGLHPRGYFLAKLLHGVISVLFVLLLISPTPLLVVLAAVLFALCAIFPQIRQKWGGNLRGHAV